jgi:predicted oxidoreductase
VQRVNFPALELSRLIYGLWRLGDDPDTSSAHVQAKLESCLSQGITSFDQADIYGDYASEKILGNALKASPALRDQMEIITKCDIMLISDKYPDRRVKYYDTSGEHLELSVNNSLQNMHIEQIDLLLIHRPDPLMDAAETGAALDALIASGKVKSVGVSNFQASDWDLLQSNMKAKLQTNQVELSLLATDAFTNGDLNFMQQHKINPMAWSPLAGGQLFDENADDRVLALRGKLEAIASEQNVGSDAVAIAWLLKHPTTILPVLGTNSLSRIATLSDATRVKLDRETWFELYTLACGHEVP